MSIGNLSVEKNIKIGSIVTDYIDFSETSGTPLQSYFNVGITGSFTGPYGIHGPVQSLGLFRKIGSTCMVSFSAMSAQTDNNAAISLVTPLPVPPYTIVNQPIFVTDPATEADPQLGNVQIDGSGNMKIYRGYDGVFTGASTAGFPAFTVVYPTYIE